MRSSIDAAWRPLAGALVAGEVPAPAQPAWLGRAERQTPQRVSRGRIWAELGDGPPPRSAAAADPRGAAPPAPPPAPRRDPELAFGEAEVARLCAAAAAEGAAAALAGAGDRRERERLDLDRRLAGGLEALAAAVAARRERLRGEASALGAALGRALAREALRREPLAEARAMLTELLAELRDEPELTVAAPAAHADALRADLARIARGAGCSGAPEVRADPGLLAGELRLTWRDGWAERLQADLEARAAGALAALADGGGDPAAVPAEEAIEVREEGIA